MSPRSFALLAALAACAPRTEPPTEPVDTVDTLDTPDDLAPASCDAGDAAFVEGAFLFLLGRRPHGAAELQRWTTLVQQHGREVVARALTHAPEHLDRWQDFIQDALGVARIGDRADPECFGDPLLPDDDGALARWLAAATADERWPAPFNMTDTIRSALQADDLSAPWRLHLFARMRLPQGGANVGPLALEAEARKSFGDAFTHTWLNRDLTCMPCHNSELAVTDRPDPAEDRHWPAPGLLERALYGASAGIDEATAFQVFRVAGVTVWPEQPDAVQPYGLAPACGALVPRDAVPADDLLGTSGYFLRDLGTAGSVWDVEAALTAGAARIRTAGMAVAPDGTVDGEEAFAWMTAQTITGLVWREAMGERLTVANYFSRNEAQRDRLVALTERFVRSGWSLRTLLVEIVTDPLFSLAGPTTCPQQDYGLLAWVNPWSWNEADPARRNNGAGDVVHRLPARVLLRAAFDALGWPAPERYPAEGSPLQSAATAIGAWQRESQPGFTGTDAQGLLAWASFVGDCSRKDIGGPQDGCQVTPTQPTCDGCGCEAEVCAADPYCCDVQWDEACVDMCRATPAGCDVVVDPSKLDALDQLLQRGVAAGASLGDVVLALRDRLTLRGVIDPAERPLLEALLGAPLDAPVTPEHGPGLRLVCGAALVSSPWMLAADAGPPGPPPPLALEDAADCAAAAAWLAAEGVTLTCGGAP